MRLSDKQIIKYQKIYKDYYGKDISIEEAQNQGANLVKLVKFVYEGRSKKNKK